MGSVWTASVWGNANKAALITSALGVKLQEGEEECMICRGDIAASVILRPCSHSVCLACVESMRAANIFKPDKGVKCPFCRSYVEQYQPTKSSMSNPAIQEIVAEANRAATIAANARIAQHNPQPPPQPAAHTIDSNWTCTHCGNQNWASRQQCNKCKIPNPAGPQKSYIKYTDVLKCNEDEILEFVKSKLHPGLNKAFSDAGMPFSANQITGTQESILNAVRNRGEERLCRVVSVLAASGQLPDCAVHFFGNYTIQDLLVATAKLRSATAAPANKFMLDGFRAQHDGLDPFGVMHNGLLEVCEEASKHQQGTYVVQKAIELGDCGETVRLAAVVFQSGMQLAADQKGVFVVIKALQHMVQFLTADTAADIQRVCDPLAALLLKDFAKTRFLGCHQLSGKILSEVVQAGLPAANAAQLGLRLVNLAHEFAKVKGGIHLVIALLNLKPLVHGTAELMRDMACMIAMVLQGQLVHYLVGEDEKGQDMVAALIERLADEQEVIWVDAITTELVNGGRFICSNEGAVEVLKYALSTSVYDPEAVGLHLDNLAAMVGDVTPIANDVMMRMANAPPPAPPKYETPSYVQPDWHYERDANGIPLQPPPEQLYVPVVAVKKHKHVKDKSQKGKGKQQRGSYTGEERPPGGPQGRKGMKLTPRSVSESDATITPEASFGALSLENSAASVGSDVPAQVPHNKQHAANGHGNRKPAPPGRTLPLNYQPQPLQQATNKLNIHHTAANATFGAEFEPAPPPIPAQYPTAAAPPGGITYAQPPPPPPPRPAAQPLPPTPAVPATVPASTSTSYAPVPNPTPPVRSYQPAVIPPYIPTSMAAPGPRGIYRPITMTPPALQFGAPPSGPGPAPYNPIAPNPTNPTGVVATPMAPAPYYPPAHAVTAPRLPHPGSVNTRPQGAIHPPGSVTGTFNGGATGPSIVTPPARPAPHLAGAAPRPAAPAPAQPTPTATGFARAAASKAAPQSRSSWKCSACTYEHAGEEAEFLACAICGTEKGAVL